MIHAAGGIVFDRRGRLLLILRGRPPGEGLWSIPGGRCEPGETSSLTCVREVAEETGLTVAVERFAGRVERAAGQDGDLFIIDDYVCTVTGGRLQAGDDARQARWCTGSELAGIPTVELLVETLASWQLLPD